MLYEFWQNFTHNLFKPLLLFFYLGFLIPILKVRFEFPYVIYQGLTMYLLLAIGWHGGVKSSPRSSRRTSTTSLDSCSWASS
ncbi:MAG: sodium-dependent bicarbonate transport family permease [Mycobacterium sp.]|uniref:sodium-dependent bicarbonate transport family permease n=1 Tax=Mycobacterium sp. TaxID=1785 RepID=UPI003F959EF9